MDRPIFYQQNNFSKENFRITENISVMAHIELFPLAAHLPPGCEPPFSLVNGLSIPPVRLRLPIP